MHEDVAQAFETRLHRDEREPDLEIDPQLARVTLKVGVHLDRNQGAWWHLGIGAEVDLLDEIEQSHVVRMLVERRTRADGEQITPWHGVSTTP